MTDNILYRRLISKNDMYPWDGIERTFEYETNDNPARTLVLDKVDYAVDVLWAYGGGASYTLGVIENAIDNIGDIKVCLQFAPGNWTITDDLEIPANFSVLVHHGAIFQITTGKTLSILGHFECGRSKCFECSGTGKVTMGVNGVGEVLPEWWGATTDTDVDSSDGLQRSFDCCLDSGGGVVSLDAGEYTVVTGLEIIKTGNANITVRGKGKSTSLITSEDITVITVKSATVPSTSYSTRILNVWLADFCISQSSAYDGIGVYLYSFGFVRLRHIHTFQFGYGFWLENGSEIFSESLFSNGDDIGLYCSRDLTAGADADFVGCFAASFFSNGVTNCVKLNGCRDISFNNGCVFAASSSSDGVVLVHGESTACEQIQFSDCYFEENDCLVIGSDTATSEIGKVSLDNCTFGSGSGTKITIHSKLTGLYIDGVVVATSAVPFIWIKSTQSDSFDLVIENSWPWYTYYNIQDSRDGEHRTNLTLTNKTPVNYFNNDFTRAECGYAVSVTPTWDTGTYVTGQGSIKIPSGNGYAWLSYDLSRQGNTSIGTKLGIPAGRKMTIEFILKSGEPDTPYLDLFAVTTDLAGGDTTATGVSTYSPVLWVQKFNNGFVRYLTQYTVPTDRILTEFRVSNYDMSTADWWLDYFAVYSDDIPVCNTLYSNSMPARGQFYAGEIVYSTLGVTGLIGTTPDRYFVLGWKRLYDGTTHVDLNDWVQLRCPVE